MIRPLPRRKLTVVDINVLVAATALAIWSANPREFGTHLGNLFHPKTNPTFRLQDVRQTLRHLAAFLVIYPPVLLAIGLRQPRPPLRRLARRPGFIACLAWTLTFAVGGALHLSALLLISVAEALHTWGVLLRPTVWTIPDEVRSLLGWVSLLFRLPILSGSFSVMAAWLTLALCGSWRPEPSWIDRAGRAVGVSTIALALLSIVF